MKYELSPSILSADFARLGEEIKAVEQTGVNYLHIDVMDGMFVPSISFGFPIIKSIRKMSNMVFDVHLMVEQPERYIEETAASGADIITIHAEACKHPDRAIEQIHQLGKKAGIALNPSTSLHELDYLLEKVDMVLLMTVNPGFGNQKYIPYCTGKVKELRTMIEERGLQTDIEVDGGINAATIDAVLEAGANILVAGSAVFGKETAKNAEKYRRADQKAQSGQRLYRHRCGSSSGNGTWGRRNYDPWRNRGTHRPYRCQCTDPVSCSAKKCASISSG